MKLTNKTRQISLRYLATTFLVLQITLISYKSESNSPTIKLEVAFKEAKANDTLILVIGSKYLLSYDKEETMHIEKTADRNGIFKFNVPVKYKFGYWQLNKKSSKDRAKKSVLAITKPFFWEVGDSVRLNLSNTERAAGIYSTYAFSGTGNEKYNCRQRIEYFWSSAKKSTSYEDPDRVYLVPNKDILKKVLDSIEFNKKDMSDLAISILKTEQIFNGGKAPFSVIYNDVKEKGGINEQDKKKALNKVDEIFSGRGLLTMDSIALASNVNSLQFIIYGLKSESVIKFSVVDSFWLYEQIKKRYTGLLKDELLAYYISFEKNDMRADSLFKDALISVTSESAKRQLSSVKHLYSIKPFASYQLLDEQGKLFDLSRVSGKVVVYDFWFTGCAACSTFYKETLSRVEEKYSDNKNVIFISVCIDKPKEKWLNSLNHGDYSGKHAINLWTGGKGFLHPILTDNNIQRCPTVMLIDKNNNLKYFNTDNLYKYDSLVSSIEEAK